MNESSISGVLQQTGSRSAGALWAALDIVSTAGRIEPNFAFKFNQNG